MVTLKSFNLNYGEQIALFSAQLTLSSHKLQAAMGYMTCRKKVKVDSYCVPLILHMLRKYFYALLGANDQIIFTSFPFPW